MACIIFVYRGVRVGNTDEARVAHLALRVRDLRNEDHERSDEVEELDCVVAMGGMWVQRVVKVWVSGKAEGVGGALPRSPACKKRKKGLEFSVCPRASGAARSRDGWRGQLTAGRHGDPVHLGRAGGGAGSWRSAGGGWHVAVSACNTCVSSLSIKPHTHPHTHTDTTCQKHLRAHGVGCQTQKAGPILPHDV
jgi:hypothetical protein